MMKSRVRLDMWGMVGVLSLLLMGAVAHLDIRSQVGEAETNQQPGFRPRLAVHPPDPEMSSDHPLHQELVTILDRVRSLETEKEIPSGWIGRLNEIALPLLYQIEVIALDVGEESRIRCLLLDVLSRFQEEAVRQYFYHMFSDPREEPIVRGKVFELFSAYLEDPVYRDRMMRDLVLVLEYEQDPDLKERLREVVFGRSK